MKTLRTSFLLFLIVLSGCAGQVKYDKAENLKSIEEFDARVLITEEVSPAVPVQASASAQATVPENQALSPKDHQSKSSNEDQAAALHSAGSRTSEMVVAGPIKNQSKQAKSKQSSKEPSDKNTKASKKNQKDKTKIVTEETVVAERRQPEYEDAEGFAGRRPLKDPFRVGEKIVHDVTYFGVSAGNLTMEVKPFAQVNGRKSYNFRFSIGTSSLFSSFYSVDDHVTILLDFEKLVPPVYKLHVKETGQLRETRMLIEQDGDKYFANFWEKKFTEKNGEEQKRTRWEVPEYSQNVFSAVVYMRFFRWKLGTEYAYSVADNEENNLFKAKVVRREKLNTPVGIFDTIVIRPEVELKGKLKPVGENLIWLSDDDRKFILRIESKIKIGTLVSEVIELDRGRE